MATQHPIEGEPADVGAGVNDYGKWLAESDVPKLFINSHPGAGAGSALRFRPQLAEPDRITVPGVHFIQEAPR